MDVAYYLSELLGQLGEVNVPGLGYFILLRQDGYYNKEEAAFYPPKHQVQFDPQFIDDDILLQYIADKKNISLASSKYFTEKYISGLKQEALMKEVPLADLGWLYFNDRLRFKAVDVLVNDPAFYGYQKLAVNTLESTSIFDQLDAMQPPPRRFPAPEPVSEPLPEISPVPILKDEPVIQPEIFAPQAETFIPEPEPIATQPEAWTPIPEAYTPPAPSYAPQQPVFTPQPENEEQEEFIFRGKTYSGGDDEEDKPKKSPWIWIIALLVLLIIAAGGVFVLYKFKPAAFRKLMGEKPAPVVLKTPLKPDTVKHDTGKTVIAPVIIDTAKKAAPVVTDTTDKTEAVTTIGPIDTLNQIRFEVSGGAFSTKKEANNAIKNYKRLGIDARILQNPTGRLYKITLGTYFTRKDALKKERELLNSGKVSESTIGIQPYLPKINPKQ